jgi:hypothetical protein
MIEITRLLARQFRAVLRRLLPPGSPRAPCPRVLLQTTPDGLTMQAQLPEAALRYHQAGSYQPASLAFAADALAAFEGRDDTPVALEQASGPEGRACWSEAGAARNVPLTTMPVETLPPFPALPRKLTPAGVDFLIALGEAVQTAARESARPALSRVLLRGQGGEVVATDGRQLLLQSGFTFGWNEDVLVPAVPVFTHGLPCNEPARLGRTAEHVAVSVGPWTILLTIDAHSRFPAYQDILPRPRPTATRLRIDPEDAELLLSAVPRMPGSEEFQAPITLELGESVCVRARGETDSPVCEVVLPRSQVTGSLVRLVTGRRYLLRAIKLGFTEVVLGSPAQPLLCRDERRTYLWMPLEAAPILAANGEGTQLAPPAKQSVERNDSESQALNPERRPVMPNPTNEPLRNGAAPPLSPEASPTPGGVEELIGEAEGLRLLLAEGHARVGRLVSALKRQRRQGRALEAAVAALRQLQPSAR